jgi:hypothetical protein
VLIDLVSRNTSASIMQMVNTTGPFDVTVPVKAGNTRNVYAIAVDNVGNVQDTTASIAVVKTPAAPLGPDLLLPGAGAAVAIVVVVGATLFLRRRRCQKSGRGP